MLQQTQAERVVPKWRSFVDRYPTPAACAEAPLGEILRLWQGLGYPRRARNLHDAAAAIVERHGGDVPEEFTALLALPGVGAYTARAVRVFAFEHDDAVVETNIARLLARVVGRRLTPKQVQAVADELVPDGVGWEWNQVLMDLGATVCRPAPRCAECPVAAGCTWHLAGQPAPDPAAGSAGVSTSQPPYDGSARQARGRVLHALASGPATAASSRRRSSTVLSPTGSWSASRKPCDCRDSGAVIRSRLCPVWGRQIRRYADPPCVRPRTSSSRSPSALPSRCGRSRSGHRG